MRLTILQVVVGLLFFINSNLSYAGWCSDTHRQDANDLVKERGFTQDIINDIIPSANASTGGPVCQ